MAEEAAVEVAGVVLEAGAEEAGKTRGLLSRWARTHAAERCARGDS